MDKETFEHYIEDQIRRAWNAIAIAGTEDPRKDYKYFQRVKKPFLKEVRLIINNILNRSTRDGVIVELKKAEWQREAKEETLAQMRIHEMEVIEGRPFYVYDTGETGQGYQGTNIAMQVIANTLEELLQRIIKTHCEGDKHIES